MLSWLEHRWRMLASGIGFTVFSIGGLLISITVFPMINAIYSDHRKRHLAARKTVQLLFHGFILFLRGLRVISVEIQPGVSDALQGGSKVVVANHPTLIDVVLIGSMVPNAQCVVKRALWDSFWLGGVMRATGYIPNDLDPEDFIQACAESLNQGDTLIIFPEGSRSEVGELRPFQRGFSNIAMAAQADIQCLLITCDPRMLAKEMKWFELPETRSLFRVSTGPKLDISEFLRYPSRSIGARKLTRRCRGYYSEILNYAAQ